MNRWILFNDLFPALPGPPSNVRASEITATSVRLTWSFNGPEDPQYYVIQFKPKYANQVSLNCFPHHRSAFIINSYGQTRFVLLSECDDACSFNAGPIPNKYLYIYILFCHSITVEVRHDLMLCGSSNLSMRFLSLYLQRQKSVKSTCNKKTQ